MRRGRRLPQGALEGDGAPAFPEWLYPGAIEAIEAPSPKSSEPGKLPEGRIGGDENQSSRVACAAGIRSKGSKGARPPLRLAAQTSMAPFDRQYVRPEPREMVLKRIQPGPAPGSLPIGTRWTTPTHSPRIPPRDSPARSAPPRAAHRRRSRAGDSLPYPSSRSPSWTGTSHAIVRRPRAISTAEPRSTSASSADRCVFCVFASWTFTVLTAPRSSVRSILVN